MKTLSDYQAQMTGQLQQVQAQLKQVNEQIQALKAQRKQLRTIETATVGALQILDAQSRESESVKE